MSPLYYRTNLSNYCGPFPFSANPCRTIPRFLQLSLCPRSSDTLSPTVIFLNMNSLQRSQSLGQILFLWPSECLSPGWKVTSIPACNIPTYKHSTCTQSGISLNLRTGPTGQATLFNQWQGALVFIKAQIKTSPQWSKIFTTAHGVGQNQRWAYSTRLSFTYNISKKTFHVRE